MVGMCLGCGYAYKWCRCNDGCHPDGFPGTDEGSHYMAQTRAEDLRPAAPASDAGPPVSQGLRFCQSCRTYRTDAMPCACSPDAGPRCPRCGERTDRVERDAFGLSCACSQAPRPEDADLGVELDRLPYRTRQVFDRHLAAERARAEAAEASADKWQRETMDAVRQSNSLHGHVATLEAALREVRDRLDDIRAGWIGPAAVDADVFRTGAVESVEAAQCVVRAALSPAPKLSPAAKSDSGPPAPKLSPAAKSDSGPPAPPEGDGDLRGLCTCEGPNRPRCAWCTETQLDAEVHRLRGVLRRWLELPLDDVSPQDARAVYVHLWSETSAALGKEAP